MGEPAVPTEEQRLERRELARAIVDSVALDVEFPIDLKASTHSPEIIESIVFGLAQELDMLAPADVDAIDAEIEATDHDERSLRLHILGTTSDLVGEFLYYGRREDEDLPRGAIEKAIADDETSVDEICAVFRAYLERGLRGH